MNAPYSAAASAQAHNYRPDQLTVSERLCWILRVGTRYYLRYVWEAVTLLLNYAVRIKYWGH